jgi:hypothetical protein
LPKVLAKILAEVSAKVSANMGDRVAPVQRKDLAKSNRRLARKSIAAAAVQIRRIRQFPATKNHNRVIL